MVKKELWEAKLKTDVKGGDVKSASSQDTVRKIGVVPAKVGEQLGQAEEEVQAVREDEDFLRIVL
jgi:hypothetical protein